VILIFIGFVETIIFLWNSDLSVDVAY